MPPHSEEISDEVVQAWKNCEIADCERKSCAAKNSKFCSPHTLMLGAEDSAPAGYFHALRAAQRDEAA